MGIVRVQHGTVRIWGLPLHGLCMLATSVLSCCSSKSVCKDASHPNFAKNILSALRKSITKDKAYSIITRTPSGSLPDQLSSRQQEGVQHVVGLLHVGTSDY